MTATVALLTGWLLALSPGQALASHVSCGDTITSNTRLDSDLIDCPEAGIRIGADHITLDLRGHTIAQAPDLADPRGGIVDRVGHDGVTIENGTVRGFDTGVFLVNATHNRLRRLTVTANDFDGIVLLQSDGNQLRNNRVSGNGVESQNNGILMFESNHNVIRDNSITENGAAGLLLGDSSDNRVEGNSLAGNGEIGINADGGDRNLVSRNRVSRSNIDIALSGDNNSIIANRLTDAIACPPDGCGDGISVEGGTANLVVSNRIARTDENGIALNAFNAVGGQSSIGTVIRNNLIHAATADAIAIGTFEGDAIGGIIKDTRLDGNVVSGSGHDGINITSASTTVTRNLAVHNGNLGIEAVAGVIDGGSNRAFASGNPLQCLNIACRTPATTTTDHPRTSSSSARF